MIVFEKVKLTPYKTNSNEKLEHNDDFAINVIRFGNKCERRR